MAESRVNTRYVTLVAIGAALGGFLFGYDTSTMNAAINGVRETMSLSSGEVGFLAAISLLGAAVGAWFAGDISSRYGRTRVMALAGAMIVIGTLGAALGGNLVLIGALRVASGIGIGAASAVVPAYITEVSPPNIRGRLGTFWQFAIVFGQFIGLLVGYGLTQWAGSEAADMPWGGSAWRWMFAVVALLAVSYIFVALKLPRSPHDLVRHGQHDEARAVLAHISPDRAGPALDNIRAQVTERTGRASLGDLRGGTLGLQSIVWVGLWLAAFQQLVGINVVKTYSNTLWQSVGVPTGASFLVSLLTVLISIIATVIAIFVMDRIGRKTLLFWGAVFIVIALATMSVAFSQATVVGNETQLEGTPAIAALIGMNVFAIAFGITWGPVMWVMLSELFDSYLRTIAVAVCTAGNWIMNWAVTRSFPLLSDNLGLDTTYGLYTLFAIAALVYTWRVLPETAERKIS